MSRTPTLRLALFLAVLNVTLIAGPAPAQAGTWSTTFTPTVPTITFPTSGAGVACPLKAECEAIGNYTSAAGASVAITYRWENGWHSPNEAATPSSAKATLLSAVACGSTISSCVAVGNYTNSSGVEMPLADELFGKGSSLLEPLTPKEAKAAALTGISCEPTTPTICQAVGSYINGSGVQNALSEQWNGKTWQLQEIAAPKQVKTYSFTGISCTVKLSNCQAVGDQIGSGGGQEGFAEEWNGKTWTLLTPAVPKGGQNISFNAVGCETKVTTTCETVGSYINSSGHQVLLAEQRNGITWQVQEPVSVGKEALPSAFNSISCATTLGICQAVGSHGEPSSQEAIIEQLPNGKNWVLEEAAVTGTEASSLNSVSCASSEACMAVGKDTINKLESPLAEQLVVAKWSLSSSFEAPTGTPSASGSAIACVANTKCLATGNYINAGGGSTAESNTWSSGNWTLQTVAAPKSAATTSMLGVGCSSTELTACVAVGSYTTTTGSQLPLVEKWNGSEWSVQEVIVEPKGKADSLHAVSCVVKLGICEAVGSFISKGGGEQALAYEGNGSSWTLQELAVPAGAKAADLSAIGCTTEGEALYCEAVGHYISEAGVEAPLAEQLKGTKWVVQKLTKMLFAEAAGFKGVFCITNINCIAFGSYTAIEDLGQIRFGERWEGTRWSSEELPDAEVKEHGELTSVSCATSQACTAVGVKNSTLIAERWLGETWTQQTLIKEGEEPHIVAVSCATLELCVAIGATKVAGQERILAEHYEGPPEVIVKPSSVKFGNAMSGERAIEYTNNGPITWNVPSLTYTVTKGKSEAVTLKNECENQKLSVGAKCSVIVQYKVPAAESYLATIKLTPAASVSVEAEE